MNTPPFFGSQESQPDLIYATEVYLCSVLGWPYNGSFDASLGRLIFVFWVLFLDPNEGPQTPGFFFFNRKNGPFFWWWVWSHWSLEGHKRVLKFLDWSIFFKNFQPWAITVWEITVPPRSLTASLPLKNCGWKTILSYWVEGPLFGKTHC